MVAEKLESLAGEFGEAGDFHASESFYNASANWYKLSGDDDKSIDMTIAQAEAFVDEASARLSSDSPSHGVAAGFVEDAIQVYRSIPRNHRDRHHVDQRLRDLKLHLSEYGKSALDEMATVSLPPIDVSDSIEQARDAVRDKSVERALAAFVNLQQISAKKLRESAIESLSSSSFRALIPKVFTTHDGRVSVRTPGIRGAIPSEQDELEIRAEMNRFHYGPLVSIAAQALILPALSVLTSEHRLREIDFIELARRSPIVPLGREVLFGKALAQGFNMDFATSLHLLTPQIEHMVRFHLKSAGVITTHLDQDGIETENGLSALIDLPKTAEIFGEDLTYEIKALFCDQLGPNLRNNIAHGLFDDQQCHSMVHTGRDRLLVDIDLDRLRARIADYFNSELSHDEIARRYPAAMRNSSAFKISDARKVREALLARGGPYETGFVRDSYRPFDNRWLYWEADRRLLTAPAPDYWPHLFAGNLWLSSAQHLRKGASEPQSCVAKYIGSFHLIERGAAMFPVWLRDDGFAAAGTGLHRRPNLSESAQRFLDRLGAGVEDLFHHVLAVLHDPTYREANAGALRMEWPRIPLPGWPDGDEVGAADELAASAARGRELAALLDSDTPVPGVTEGVLRPEIAVVAVPSITDGGNMAGTDFALTAGWGHFGQGEAVMPGQGRVIDRPHTADERAALGGAVSAFGETTFDVYLNDRAYWSNVPASVWSYKLGGYQVLKKWLSYREHGVLERALLPEEVQHFTDTARRIAAHLMVVGAK